MPPIFINIYGNNTNPYNVTLSYTVPTNVYEFSIYYGLNPVSNLSITSQPGLSGTTDYNDKYFVTFPNSTSIYNVTLSGFESVDSALITYNLTFNITYSGGSTGATGTTDVPCITAGQRILTPDGYRLIEELQTGELILTSDKRPVKAIVRKFTIPVTDHETAPITIPANFFYHSYPPKAITLSPYHRVFVRDGEWIEPKKLVLFFDNPNVKQTNIGESVTYYHVKTPNYYKDHLVVEGCIIDSLIE
jgi:hypothetical protein